MLKDWMIDQGCVNSTWVEKNHDMIRYGWSRGRSFVKNVNVSTIPAVAAHTCPHFSLVHNEVDCLNGMKLLASPVNQHLPPLSQAQLFNLTDDHSGRSIRSRRPLTATAVTLPARLVYFTTLRDPIERIGSQAFYYGGVGRNTMYAIAKTMCGNGNAIDLCKAHDQHSLCSCSKKAAAAAQEALKFRPELWFEWFNRSSDKNWQADFYASNYYTRRLTSGSPLSLTTVSSMNKRPVKRSTGHSLNRIEMCIQNPSRCSRVPEPRIDIHTLRAMGQHVYCHTPWPGRSDNSEQQQQQQQPQQQQRLVESVSLEVALQHAKTILRDRFEFVITERMSSPAALAVFRRVLGTQLGQKAVVRTNSQSSITFSDSALVLRQAGEKVESMEGISAQSIGGDVGNMTRSVDIPAHKPIVSKAESRSYTEFMPPTVLEYLKKENALDLELYRYAVELFEARARAATTQLTV